MSAPSRNRTIFPLFSRVLSVKKRKSDAGLNSVTQSDSRGLGCAHCEGIRQAHRRGEVGATRSPTDLCSPLPCFGRRVGADPIPFGARLSSNHRTISWLQAAASISGRLARVGSAGSGAEEGKGLYPEGHVGRRQRRARPRVLGYVLEPQQDGSPGYDIACSCFMSLIFEVRHYYRLRKVDGHLP
jgi:hypothetical protein